VHLIGWAWQHRAILGPKSPRDAQRDDNKQAA
jgi:hypothetical protein